MPATMATIIAVNTAAMILFHSKDDIGVLSVSPCGRRHHRTVARAAENRIPRSNSTELLRFRQACEAGILSPLGSSDDCTVSALPTNPIILIPTPLAAEITDPAALHDTSVNKVAAGFADPKRPARALYFSKAPVPWGEGPHYEHVGLYAYRRAALDRFVGLPRGVLEQRERLEQLRALEAGMTISVSLIEPDQLGVQVDTPADLDRARLLMETARG